MEIPFPIAFLAFLAQPLLWSVLCGALIYIIITWRHRAFLILGTFLTVALLISWVSTVARTRWDENYNTFERGLTLLIYGIMCAILAGCWYKGMKERQRRLVISRG